MLSFLDCQPGKMTLRYSKIIALHAQAPALARSHTCILQSGFWLRKQRLDSRFEVWIFLAMAESKPTEPAEVLQGLSAAVCPPEAKDEEGSGSGKGLALKWDNNEIIRQRMRQGFNLLVHHDDKLKKFTNAKVEKTMKNVKANTHVISPVCRMMNASGLTNIYDLEHEVKQIFAMCNIVVAKATIISQAWSVRYLIQVLKSSLKADKKDKTKIKRCPKDSWLEKNTL